MDSLFLHICMHGLRVSAYSLSPLTFHYSFDVDWLSFLTYVDKFFPWFPFFSAPLRDGEGLDVNANF